MSQDSFPGPGPDGEQPPPGDPARDDDWDGDAADVDLAELAAMLGPDGRGGEVFAQDRRADRRVPGLADLAATRHLSDADAARADEILAVLAPGLRYDQLARKATAVAMKLDPEAFERGKEKARADRDPPGRLVPLTASCPPGSATQSLPAAVPAPPGWRVAARRRRWRPGCPGASAPGAVAAGEHACALTWSMMMAAEAASPPGSGGPAFVTRSQRPDQLAEARRSSRSSACPDSTPVRISRATASSSATCGLVRE